MLNGETGDNGNDPRLRPNQAEQKPPLQPHDSAVNPVAHMSQDELIRKAQEQFNAMEQLGINTSNSSGMLSHPRPPLPVMQSQPIRGHNQQFMGAQYPIQQPPSMPMMRPPNGHNMNPNGHHEQRSGMYSAGFQQQQMRPIQPMQHGSNQANAPPHRAISFGWKRKR